MADLIIKPLTGAGNTVKIQDQAGGAILTSENSGATIGGGVTIPAAGVTGVLPAGVTGGSGLDALNLGNATFPAGHIVQYRPIKYGTYTGAINSPTSSATWQASNLYDTITFTAGNRIVAMANLYLHAYSGGADTAAEAQFSDDGTASGVIGATGEHRGAQRVRMYITNNTKYAQHNFLMGETSPSGTSVTLTVGFYVASGGSCDLGVGSCFMQLFEVQA